MSPIECVMSKDCLPTTIILPFAVQKLYNSVQCHLSVPAGTIF